MNSLLDPADCRPGASPATIAATEAALGRPLTADLSAFLAESDGYDGEINGHYLTLWGTAELADLATGYDVLPVTATQMLIGSNGGPTAFGVIDGRYVSIPFDGGMADMRVLADDFAGFLAAIAGGEGW